MTDDLKGTVFNGRYTILERIGTGGMATVYRSRDEETTDFVAVKILSRDFLSKNPKEAERNLRRFKREAEILKLLHGSLHVVGFLEHACSETGDWFIAMELLEGEQLRYHIGRGRSVMGLSTFAHFGSHLLQGLKEIHGRNILHRDLAPDNVIVVKDKSGLLYPKFLDFGIGKSMGDELDQVTQMLTIMGKPQYFSPEQARGLDLSPASDVYSMGVMLYEMITGYVPLEIHGIPDFRKIQKDPPIAISSYREGQRITQELQDAIMGCLAKKPEDRPLLDELSESLESFRARISSADGLEALTNSRPTSPDHTAPLSVIDVELRPGDSISRYEIKGVLGRGGMGAVYLAWDPVLHREIAIKVATRVEEEKAKKALLREARASSALRTENIVTIYDAGTDGGTPYIAMEYVAGQTLAELIEEQGPLDEQTYFEIASGMCRALRFAHERERPVVHRDLKPANMLVARHNQVKITDFGIARVANNLTMQPGNDTQSHGVAEGTVAIMSPEQANGKPADERSDIYSLGCVLYMMATGRGPFQGNQIAILYQHCTAEPDPPSKHNPGLQPKGLDKIVLKCLAKDPAHRFQSVAAIESDLQKLFAPDDPESIPWYRSRFAVATLTALVLAVAGLTWSLFGSTGSPARPVTFAVSDVGSIAFDTERTEAYLVSSLRLPLRGSAAPNSKITVELTPEDQPSRSMTFLADERGLFSERVELPLSEGAALARVRVHVGPEQDSKTGTTFDVLYDGRDPTIEVKVHESQAEWESLPNLIQTLDPAHVRFRIKDQGGSGFNSDEGVIHECELGVDASKGKPLRVAWLKEGAGDEIRITAVDRSERTRNQIVRLKLVTPSVVSAEAPPTRAAQVQVRIELEAKGLEHLPKPLIREGLVASVVGHDMLQVPLEPDGQRYLGHLALPNPDDGKVHVYDIAFAYRGRRLLGTPCQVKLDLQKPILQLRLLDGSSDGGTELLSSDALPAAKPTYRLKAGGTMGSSFSLELTDGEEGVGFGDGSRVLVSYDGGERRPLTISGPSRRFSLPNELPEASTFPVRISVADLVGNEAALEFSVEVPQVRVVGLEVLNAEESADRTFYVNKDQSLELSARISGVAPGGEVSCEIFDAANPTQRVFGPIAVTLQGDRWKAVGLSLENQFGRPDLERLLKVTYRPPTGEVQVLDQARLIFDSQRPTVTAKVLDTLSAPPRSLGHFPEIRIDITDTQSLRTFRPEDVVIEQTDTSRPKPEVRIETEHTGAVLHVTAPAGPEVKNSYRIRLTAADRAGNATEPFELAFAVAPPSIVAKKIGANVPERPSQHAALEDRLALSNDRLSIELANRGGAGIYEIAAALIPPEGEPVRLTLPERLVDEGSIVVELAPLPKPEGRIELSFREVVNDWRSAPRGFESISYVVDSEEPTWEVWVHGSTVDRALLRDDRIQVVDLGAVEIRIKDGGGFPKEALTDQPGLPAHDRRVEGQLLALTLRNDPGWSRQDVDFVVRDVAGNSAHVHFRIQKAKDHPTDLQLLSASGQPLAKRIDGTLATSSLQMKVRCNVDSPQVAGAEYELKDSQGRSLGRGSLETSGSNELEASIDLPEGQKRIEVEFYAILRRGGRRSQSFLKHELVVDNTPPNISWLLNNQPLVGSPTLADLSGLRIRVDDESPVDVACQVTEAGRIQPLGLRRDVGNTWSLQPTTTPSGTLTLSARAWDDVGNKTPDVTVSVTMRAPIVVVPPRPPPPRPPPVSRFSAESVRGKTGIKPVAIGTAGRVLFHVGETEVTVGQFKRFYAEFTRDPNGLLGTLRQQADTTGMPVPPGWDPSSDIRTAMDYNNHKADDMPVGFITSGTAFAYAVWAGGRLPTQEEWCQAAGRLKQPVCKFPLKDSEEAQNSRTLKNNNGKNRWANCGKGQALAIQELVPDDNFRLYGMAGNLAEWVVRPGGIRTIGTIGGSFKYDADHEVHGAMLDRMPHSETQDVKSLGHVGMRVVWDAQ